MVKIVFANLHAQYLKYKNEIDCAIQRVIDSSQFIMGEEVKELEDELSRFTNTQAITCANGTDALLIALMGIGIEPGDEVITTPFTFISTAEVIASLKAKPVFVDISEEDFNIDAEKIESAITSKTKAIIPVSLFGQPSEMDKINEIAKNYQLRVIEDAAQSFGATYKGKRSCNLSELATTSFFPAKPLGCYGDGGAIFTSNTELAEKIRSIRNHGQIRRYYHKYVGLNSRLDTLQAAILRVKLKYYNNEIDIRNEVAKRYTSLLSDKITPKVKSEKTSVWAQYTVKIKSRDHIQGKLQSCGIPTAVHYPLPLHLQEAFAFCERKKGDFPVAEKASMEVLSLPFSAYLTEEEQGYICNKLNSFLGEE